MSARITVGMVPVWIQFKFQGRTYRRMGLWSYDSPVLGYLYSPERMLDIKTQDFSISHQNNIVVQCKEDGAFYFAECEYEIDELLL